MADKRTARELLDDDLENFEEEAAPEEDAKSYEEQLTDNFLAEFQGASDVEVKLYAQGKNAKDLEYLFTTSPEAHTMGQILDTLRDDYNGGTFRVVVRRDGKIAAARSFKVRPPLRRDHDGGSSRAIEELRREMEERERRGQSEIAQLISAMHNNTTQMIQQSQNSQMEMMRMMLENSNRREPGLWDDPEKLVLLKSLFGGDEKKADPMETFFKAFEFAQNVSGAKETTTADALLAAVKEIGPSLATLGRGAAAALPPPSPDKTRSAVQPPAPQPQPQPRPQAIGPAPFQIPPRVNSLQEMIAVLLEGAQRAIPPERFVDMILESVDADAAFNLFSTEEGRAQILAYVPPAAEHSDWLAKLGHEIDLATMPEDDPEQSSQEEAAHVPDASASDGDRREPGDDSLGDSGRPSDAPAHGANREGGEGGPDPA